MPSSGRSRISAFWWLKTIERIDSSVGKMLNNWGATVHFAENGQEAIEMFGSHGNDIDVVLMDCEMPKWTATQPPDTSARWSGRAAVYRRRSSR